MRFAIWLIRRTSTFDGDLENQGTINVHGARSLTGLQQLLNFGLINYQLPLLPSRPWSLSIAARSCGLSGAQLVAGFGQNFGPIAW